MLLVVAHFPRDNTFDLSLPKELCSLEASCLASLCVLHSFPATNWGENMPTLYMIVLANGLGTPVCGVAVLDS